MVRGTVEIRRTLTIEVEECISCGALFGLAADYQQRRRQDHAVFYCPNGHGQHYAGESDAERLARELREAQAALAEERRYTAEQSRVLKAERQAHATTKGQLTKARTRAAAGVCQWCNRSFVNVTRHVATKHPDHDAVQRGRK